MRLESTSSAFPRTRATYRSDAGAWRLAGAHSRHARLLAFSVGDLANRRSPAAARIITEPRAHIGAPCKAQPSSGGGLGLFPAGQQQAKVQLPAVMLMVDAAEVMGDGEGGSILLESINEAVTAGATALVLKEGESGGASQL